MKHYSLIVIILLCILLQACSPVARGYHPIGSAWEAGDSTVTLQQISLADTYATQDGKELSAAPACTLLIVTCVARLGDGVQIDACQVSKSESSSKSYAMQSLSPGNGEHMYDLIFNIPSAELTEDMLEQYCMDMALVGEEVRYTGLFTFINPQNG